jgi:hypothetical protein
MNVAAGYRNNLVAILTDSSSSGRDGRTTLGVRRHFCPSQSSKLRPTPCSITTTQLFRSAGPSWLESPPRCMPPPCVLCLFRWFQQSYEMFSDRAVRITRRGRSTSVPRADGRPNHFRRSSPVFLEMPVLFQHRVFRQKRTAPRDVLQLGRLGDGRRGRYHHRETGETETR